VVQGNMHDALHDQLQQLLAGVHESEHTCYYPPEFV
jgi:hypothetical protein